jgi:hypothetical protein
MRERAEEKGGPLSWGTPDAEPGPGPEAKPEAEPKLEAELEAEPKPEAELEAGPLGPSIGRSPP